MPDMTPSPEAVEAAARIAHYIAMRKAQPLRQATDEIHGIHIGTEWEATLRLSDLKAVVAALTAAAPLMVQWQPIETAPKDRLIDILIEGKIRWCDCYYDDICDQWRTTRPSGHLICIAAKFVTHWSLPMPLSPSPEAA